MNSVVNYVAIVEIGAVPDGLILRPEMTAHVSFELERNDHALTVPRSALLREGGASYVFVQHGTRFTKTRVEIGASTPQRIEIVRGIDAGAVVVADAQRWQEQSMEEGR